MYEFYSIMTAHGLSTGGHDIESSIIGFDYDIQFSLFDQATVFDVDKCLILRQRDNPEAFVQCELVTGNGDIQAAISFFLHRWSTELRYQSPVREIIDIRTRSQSARIHILTISQFNAMTLLFTIR